VALLLLLLLSWGATAELTHRHSNGRTDFAESRAALSTFDSNTSSSSSRANVSDSECLICQLHQNLFATLFHHVPHLTPATAQYSYSPATITRYRFQSAATQHGRAPPFVL
jgi:hypothetical protein